MPPSEAPLTEIQCVIEKRPSGQLRKWRTSRANHLRAKGKLLERNLCSQPVAKMLNKHRLRALKGPHITLYCLQAQILKYRTLLAPSVIVHAAIMQGSSTQVTCCAARAPETTAACQGSQRASVVSVHSKFPGRSFAMVERGSDATLFPPYSP